MSLEGSVAWWNAADYDAARALLAAGYSLIAVAAASMTKENAAAALARIQSILPHVNLVYCPHTQGEKCICRPPHTFLLHTHMRGRRLDSKECMLVGTSYGEVTMGSAAGIGRIAFAKPGIPGEFSRVSQHPQRWHTKELS